MSAVINSGEKPSLKTMKQTEMTTNVTTPPGEAMQYKALEPIECFLGLPDNINNQN